MAYEVKQTFSRLEDPQKVVGDSLKTFFFTDETVKKENLQFHKTKFLCMEKQINKKKELKAKQKSVVN